VGQLISKIEMDADIIRSDDVLDLPPKRFQRVPVVLEPAAWDAYQKMAYELFLELKDGDTSDAKNVAVKILRLQQITGGWIKSDEGRIHQISEVKLNTTRDHLEDLFNDDERVVVFARFRPEVQAVYDLGARFKVESHVLRGGMGREERDQARRQFQSRPGPSLFVAQIQAGGLGITLHSSHEVLFYSVTYALDDYIQAYKRVHRGGQTHAVLFRHLVAKSTIDIDVYANLRAKQDIMDVVMNPRGRKMLMRSLARNLGIDED
jgi:ERCC4-related helicase